MKKQTLRLFILVISLLLFVGVMPLLAFAEEPAAEDGPMTLTVSSAMGIAGETVQVDIILSDNPGLAALSFDVEYDDCLTLTGVTFNSEFGPYITAPEPFTNPQAITLISPLADVAVEGVLATLTFEVSENVPDNYVASIRITYDAEDVYNGDYESVELAVVNGSILLYQGLPGDINGDGVVDTKDAILLFRYVAGWDVEVDLAAVDVNGDGKVNTKDAVELFRYVAGWEGIDLTRGEITSHVITYVDAKPATCTEIGWNAYEYCTHCDYTTYEEIPAIGHIPGAAPTCTEPQVCTVCGVVLNPACGHIFGPAPTCTEDQFCRVCGWIIAEKLGHTPGEAIVENSTPAGCTTAGSYESVVYCSVCDIELSRRTIVIPATGHNYVSTVTPPTCTEKGYTTHTCGCGDSFVDTYVNATGHSYTSEVTKAPTCTENGMKTFTCNCGRSYTEMIPTAVHTITKVAAKAPTCTEIGWNAHEYCANCDYTTKVERPATGHNYVNNTCSYCGATMATTMYYGDAGTIFGYGQWVQFHIDEAFAYNGWQSTGHGTNTVLQLTRENFSFRYYGWYGVADDCRVNPGIFGYSVDGGEPVYNASFMWSANDEGALGINVGAGSAPVFAIDVDLTSLSYGYHRLNFYYKMANGNVIVLDMVDINIENPNNETIVLAEFTGTGAGVHNVVGATKYGMRFNVGDRLLKQIKIDTVATFEEKVRFNFNSWSVKIWSWKGDYASTQAGVPLYTVSGENHGNGLDFYVNIPDDVNITGEVLVELSYDAGGLAFTGWVGSNPIEGYQCYLHGFSDLNGTPVQPLAASISVTKGAVDPEPEPKPDSIGLAYKVNADGTTCTITGLGTCTDLDVVIPAYIDGYKVTSIGSYAFFDCSSLTSIIIPDGVTSIGNYAFCVCSSLTSITVDENNEYYKSIDGILYNENGTTLIQYAVGKTDTSFIIPDSVVSIGDSAFFGCSSLTSVIFGENSQLASIGETAFYDCSSLTSIIIPDSVTSIGVGVFGYCTELASITVAEGNRVYHSSGNCIIETATNKLIAGCKNSVIPDGVTSIGDDAFFDCGSLTSIIIPDSVTSIGRAAFSGCSGLTSIIIPDSVTSIGEWAFAYCTGLTSIYYTGTEAEWNAIVKGSNWDFYTDDYTIYYNYGAEDETETEPEPEAETETIVLSQFDGYTNPQNLVGAWIYGMRFNVGTSSLRCLTINRMATFGDSVNTWTVKVWNWNTDYDTTVAGTPLYGISGTNHLDGIDFILIIPDGVVITGEVLVVLTYESGNTAFTGWIGSNPVEGYQCYLHGMSDVNGTPVQPLAASIVVTKGAVDPEPEPEPEPGSTGLAYSVNADGTTCTITGLGTCTDLDVVIPAYIDGYKVTSIGFGAFSSCSSLTSITIPDSVTSIGYWAFSSCSSLMSITVDENNEYYKSTDGILYNKDGTTLIRYAAGKTDTSFSIPDGVTSIDDYAFACCSSLTSINIPDDVTRIGIYAFDGCSSLTSIIIPEGVTSIGFRAFHDCSSLTSIIVDENNEYYKSTDGILYNKDGTTLIRYAVGKTDTSFSIPESVTSIDDYAFDGCGSLTSISIPEGVTSIGYRTFADCSSLTSMVFGENSQLMSIGMEAFCHCSSLTSIIIPEGVTSIGYNTFNGCSGLTSIIIPEGVTSIGDYAFACCSSLTSVIIPDSVTSIGDYAFAWCSSLTSIIIPDGVTSIGDHAFYGCSSLTSIIIPDSVTSIGNYAFYYCSRLTSIYYTGTEAEWNAITKGSNWDYGTGDYTIYFNYNSESEPETETIVLAQFDGTGAGVQNAVGARVYGMQFNVGEAALKQFTIYQMATFADSVNGWTAKIYQWRTDYETTVSGAVLYEVSGTNHQECTDFILNIPDGVVITGEVLVVLTYESGNTAFTGWIGSDPVEGYQCYLHGFSDLDGTPVQPMAASIVVTKGVDDPDLHVHTPGPAATCTADQTCTACGEVLAERLGHDYDAVDSFLTCTKGGYTTYICERCGDSYVDNYTEPTYHNFVDDVCTVCQATKTGYLIANNVINPLLTGHGQWAVMRAYSTNITEILGYSGTSTTAPDILPVERDAHTFQYFAWICLKNDDCRVESERGIFGYSVDGDKPVFSNDFFAVDGGYHNQGVQDAGLLGDGKSAPTCDIRVPMSNLSYGYHRIEVYYMTAGGDVIVLDVIDINIPDPDLETVVLAEFTGLSAGVQNAVGATKYGMRFNVGAKKLDQLIINSLVTFEELSAFNRNAWTVLVYAWNTDYSTTVAGEVLYTTSGTNHVNGRDFYLNIPDDVILTGEILVELNYTAGGLAFTGWVGSDPIEGYQCYLHGMSDLGGTPVQPIAASIEISCIHNYFEEVVDPTCTEDGYTAHTCTKCGDSYVTDVVASLGGHKPGAAATCTTDQICTVCNDILVSAPGHTPAADADCSTLHNCIVCGEEINAQGGHTPGVAPTCTTAQTCKICGEVIAEALGHTPGAAATCIKEQTCTVCDEVLGGKGDHNYQPTVTPPTCLIGGYTTYICVVCSDSYVDDYTEPTGQTVALSQFVGTTAVQNAVGARKYGFQFNIGNNPMKRFTIYKMAGFADSVNTWTVKIYRWNTNYTITTSSVVLYQTSGTNHADSTDFVLNIPDDVVITGEVLIELSYDSGNTAFTGWVGADPIEGYQCYLHGMSEVSGTPVQPIAAGILVDTSVEVEPEGDPEPEIEPYPTDKLTFVDALNSYVFGMQWSQYKVDGIQTYQAWAGASQNVTTFEGGPVSIPILLSEGTQTFGYYGWIGVSDNCLDPNSRGIFGYSIDGGSVIYNTTFFWVAPDTGAYTYHNQAVFEGNLTPGATTAPSFDIVVDLAGLENGTHTVESFYKTADGTVILLDSIKIAIGFVTPEPEPEIDGDRIVLSQFNGATAQNYWNDDQTSKIGQRFNIGTSTLKQLTINSVATFEGAQNTFTVSFWQWSGNYDATVSGTPLYMYNGSNHVECTDFVLDIPEDVILSGDLYYEINVLSSVNALPGSPAVFMPWIGIDQVEGLASYRGGVLWDTNYASGIVVKKVNENDPDTLPLEPEVFGPVIEEVPLHLGEVTGDLQNPDGKTLGLRFDMWGDTLAQIGIYDMQIADGSNPNDWVVKIYEWTGDYASTIEGDVLFEGTGAIDNDGRYVVNVPAELEITCNVLVVIEGMQSGDSGYVTDDPWEEWGVDESFYNCYLDGELTDLVAAFYAYVVPEDMM